MRDYVYLGPAPAEEDCVQVGEPDYLERALAECRRYIDLIRRVCGPEPPGARLRTKWEYHDFGKYVEVVCEFDDNVPEAVEYAYRVEEEAPTRWD